MTQSAITSLRHLCRLVASRAPVGKLEEELHDRPGGDAVWERASVQGDTEGRVDFVHLEVADDTLDLSEVEHLGAVDRLPAVMAGDPSTHLLVVDDPEQPELCRVVLSVGTDERVRALSLQPDTRL